MDKTKKFEAVVKYLKNEIDYNQLGDVLVGEKDIDFFNEDNYQKYKQEKMELLKDSEFYQYLIDNDCLVSAMKEFADTDILSYYLNIRNIQSDEEAIERKQLLDAIVSLPDKAKLDILNCMEEEEGDYGDIIYNPITSRMDDEVLKNIILSLSEEERIKFLINPINRDLHFTRIKKKIYYKEKQEDNKKLNEEQQHAFNTIINSLNINKTFLLYGVTGSGKTLIYIHLIKEVIKKGKTAILLVPEISLTEQIVSIFYQNFGSDVAILHSGLSNKEKYEEYIKILNNEIKIVIGTRSAIFAPLKNIGIIIIDEEHSDTYKQENTPRYHARDIAMHRCEFNRCPLILGSATPSLESMARAKKNVYELVTLKNRANNLPLPEVSIVDMKMELEKRNFTISELLDKKIKECLDKGEQVILLLNRRGFSTFITCSNCGFTYKCPHCEISLTYHKSSNTLRCHYCGYTKIKDDLCPECHEKGLNYMGMGTEKLEEIIKEKYESAKVIRMEADTTTRKGAHDKIIKAFKNEEYNILIGTQMISKGLDFPKCTLVGVINADTSLNIPDFRSSEKTFSLLDQAAGRAGRSTTPGSVIIQTFNPDNETIKAVKKHDYDSFYEQEMQVRKILKYPPYYYLANIKIASKEYTLASTESTKVKNYLEKNLDPKSIILGPSTASNFKRNNIYRFSITIKYRFDEHLMKVLKELDNIYATNKNVFLEIDINPLRI